MRRRQVLVAGSAGATASVLGAKPGPDAAAASSRAAKTLRVAFNTAEVGFDPPRVSDQSSLRINAHIFEAPLSYDLLARPAQLVPLTAAQLPEVSADFRRFVVTLQRGIYFADDAAFKGQRRELVAADYVFSIKRYYDPAVITEHLYLFENEKILGLSELRQQVLKDKRPFPYGLEVAGLRALDRYRFEVVLADPSPRFSALLAAGVVGAVAHEVVQAYGSELMAHPVGTGPFRLTQWRRGSRIVLERNPGFREQRFATLARFGPDDPPHLQAAARHLAGARAPLLDRVEVQIITEAQPLWLRSEERRVGKECGVMCRSRWSPYH